MIVDFFESVFVPRANCVRHEREEMIVFWRLLSQQWVSGTLFCVTTGKKRCWKDRPFQQELYGRYKCHKILLQGHFFPVNKEKITKEHFVRDVAGILMSSDIIILINRGIKWYYLWNVDIL